MTSLIRRPPVLLVALICVAVLLALMVVSIGWGPLAVKAGDVMRIIAFQLGLDSGVGLNQRDISVVLTLRVPRIFMGVLVGAALAVSGAALQSLFTNPLADPSVIGISGGAATGAVAMIVIFGGGAAWLVPLGAFVSGLAVTALIYLLARPGRGGGTTRILLVGIAVGSGCQALIGFFTYIADDTQLQTVVFWQLGSLGKVTGIQVLAVLPVFAVGMLLIGWHTRALDALTLGERTAEHLGVDVVRARALITIAAALLVGAAVSFAGSIAFVGLVVPHIMRLLVGPAHRSLLPLSALAGAILLVAADAAARNIDPPLEVPIGLFTAAVGAPFFLFLVLRSRRTSW